MRKAIIFIALANLFAFSAAAKVTTYDVSKDDRQCTAYVQAMTGMKPSGIGPERPDSEHKAYKEKLIDARIKQPQRGDVAIIASSAAWHVAYVEKVGVETKNKYKKALDTPVSCYIIISETNFKRGKYQKRKSVADTCEAAFRDLKIRGFYRP